MSLKTYLRRHVYRWHRLTSLVVAVPVLLWTVSGFLHPVMGSFKPAVKNNFLPAAVIDTAKVKVPLRDALARNGIQQFRNFRFVSMKGELWYQVAQDGQDSLTYISCANGALLPLGDKMYAAWLAQRYASEENGESNLPEGHRHHHLLTAGFAVAPFKANDKTTESNSAALSTTLLTKFTHDYKGSNKILPGYEVALDREDGLTLFIETGADRLALASDNNKRWYSTLFSFAHSWSFLDGLGKTKSFLLGFFAALCFLTSVFRFAVYNVLNKRKKAATAGQRWHRALGNLFLLTTLLYGFSGAWHSFAKLPAKPVLNGQKEAIFCTQAIPSALPFSGVPAQQKLTNISLVQIEGEPYWQLFCKKGKEKEKRYLKVSTGEPLAGGEEKYASLLACQMKRTSPDNVQQTKTISAFTHHYSMMNKRLPVEEVVFKDGDLYYMETSSGTLAAITRPANGAERFSFSNLHMHHYWEMWLGKEVGKPVRNTVLIFSTLGLLLLALTGMWMYARKKRRTV